MKYFKVILLIFFMLCIASCSVQEPSDKTEIPIPTITPTVDFTPEPTSTLLPITFTKEEFPKLDGSTANIPLGTAIIQKLLNVSQDEADLLCEFNTTADSYINLVEKKTDLLLVYEASEKTKEDLSKAKEELEYYPIGLDALVFICNETNPVKTLTTKQIQDIYTGNIKNWKDVGGEDKVIEAFQRDETSGSQTLMQKLMMKDLKMTKPKEDYKPGTMGGLISSIAEYNNTSNALGYSVFYYAKNMYTKPGLTFMGVDGVLPSNETIKDGTYKYTNEFYAVIRKSEPADSPTRKLLEWILSNEGKKIIEEAGYVAK